MTLKILDIASNIVLVFTAGVALVMPCFAYADPARATEEAVAVGEDFGQASCRALRSGPVHHGPAYATRRDCAQQARDSDAEARRQMEALVAEQTRQATPSWNDRP